MSDALFDIEPTNCPKCGRVLSLSGLCAWCENPLPGLVRKERGMKQALSPDVLAEWKDEFRTYVGSLPNDTEFTSEDVVDAVGLPSGDVRTNANNAVGAMMNGLARRGLITKTGVRVQSKRPSSHGAELILWVRRARPSTMESHEVPDQSADRRVCRHCGTSTCARRPGYAYCYGPSAEPRVSECPRCGAQPASIDSNGCARCGWSS